MRWRDECGQLLPVVAALAVVILAVAVAATQLALASLASGQAQTAADLAALAAARELGRRAEANPTPESSARQEIEEAVSRRARAVARASGAELDAVTLPAVPHGPVTAAEVRVSVPGPMGTEVRATAAASLRTTTGTASLPMAGRGYSGPLVKRDGRPMCPAVAGAYDRMSAVARGDGVALVVTSGFRSDAEQAELFRRRPDPRWVAPPGRSRHRDATELDIAGGGAWAWLAANAGRFGFIQRYSWEPWHWGYRPGCGAAEGATRDVPAWVPRPYRRTIRDAATEHGLSAAFLAAVIRAESGFNPRAVSPAGARGIAQFTAATALQVGLRDPFDPDEAILAAADLLAVHRSRFGSLALALAAYNAGPGAVVRFGGVPPYGETQHYIARILALAGELNADYSVRLDAASPRDHVGQSVLERRHSRG